MKNLIQRLAERDNRKPGDYLEQGILMCGACHRPKQTRLFLPIPGGQKAERLLPISCLCETMELEEVKATQERREFEGFMSQLQERYGLSDSFYRRFRFEIDDVQDQRASTVSRRYVARWPEMKQDNIGLLFYGTVGTGKSFYACAIANALLEQCVPTAVTNFPRILNILQNTRERQQYIDHLKNYELLVIDDLGTERESSYAAEQIFNVIDSRSRMELPLIVTTNLTWEELTKTRMDHLARIYDRILEMCPLRLKMVGESRRIQNAERRNQKARELLR